MDLGYDLFIAAISAFMLVLVISFWAEKLGCPMELSTYALIFVISALVIFFFLLLAPKSIQTIALYIGIAIIVLTLIINLLTQ